MCIATGALDGASQLKFRAFCKLMQSVFHFEYHDHLELLKNLYAPINPNRDTRKIGVVVDEGDVSFTDSLDELLNKANYEKMSQSDIEAAFEESSLFELKLNIDFDDFSEVLVYARGESQNTETVSTLFGLIKREITFSNFDRVVIYVRYKDEVGNDAPGSKPGATPGATMLKLFQNVPRADIEMLFPNTRLGMRNIDKLMIGVPALVGAGAIITTNVGASLILLATFVGFYIGVHSERIEMDEARLLAILAGLGGLGSYIWKQFSNFRNRKLLFMQSLTQNLYFKNLDNNAGVFHRLMDDAEEEECKEAILAYYFLLAEGSVSNEETLDRGIEDWFAEHWDCELDFEVDDALEKLKRLGLVKQRDQLEVVELEDALRLLDQRWDNYFDYHSADATEKEGA